MKMKKLFIPVTIAASGLLCAGFIFTAVTVMQAPDLSQVSASPTRYQTTILDDEGNITQVLAGTESNRKYITLDQIPEDLQNAFIAIEDSRFYSHHGIDPKGILRAAVKGITTGNFSEGGSTITQQLLKNNVFTDWMDEETFLDKVQRKIQEQYLAIRLEQQESKEWILENYLNTINLGNGAWGVEVASEVYFDKDVSELDLAESALIAGITKNPSGYDPKTNPDAAKERQELVLEAMLDQGYISQDEYDTAIAEPVIDTVTEASGISSDEPFSYFEDALLLQVKDDLMSTYGYTSEKAWDMIYSGGLTICSTEDPDIQGICENVATSGDYTTDNQQISIVVTSVDTGAVKAIIGGSGSKTASLTLNRATDSLRQPGSTIKIPGEYAAGLDEGLITLGTAIDDAPTSYSNGTEIHNADYTFSGMITVEDAITDSVNTVALKCFKEVGSDTVISYLNRFGIDTLNDESDNEALALGGTETGVTNLAMTAAYNAIAAGGTYVEPYYYSSVLDMDGNEILSHHSEPVSVISESTASLLTKAMQNVMAEGTGTPADFSGMPTAGKSGTTSNMTDVWMIGYTPYYTCGVWGGYDDGSSQESNTYVKKIWQAVMSEVHENYYWKAFDEDEDLVPAEICSKCGKLAISGLCDVTVQGDATEYIYFTPSTVPTEYCDCHESVSICTESGMRSGSYCPADSVTTKVYLKNGTEGTDDADYVIPDDLTETCTAHQSAWDTFMGLFGNDTTTESETGSEEDYGYSDYDNNEDYGDGSTYDYSHPDEEVHEDHSYNDNSDASSDYGFSDFFDLFR